jgi:hypothetical protein
MGSMDPSRMVLDGELVLRRVLLTLPFLLPEAEVKMISYRMDLAKRLGFGVRPVTVRDHCIAWIVD